MSKGSALIIFSMVIAGLLIAGAANFNTAEAYGECSEYGFGAEYDYVTDSCKCRMGYMWSKDMFGDPKCIDKDSYCRDKYGYNAEYDSLSNSCECGYGYVLGKNSIGQTECVSEDQACKNQYGYNAKANYAGKCECKSGYEFTQRAGGLQCVSCTTKYGFNSSYNHLANKCECDDGYTLKGGECVEKQNNVYFQLKELDKEDNEAIIQSEYSSQNYHIEYGFSCPEYLLDNYKNGRIVVNLGTDFYIEWGDKLVLQDHSRTCEVRSVSAVGSGFTLQPEATTSFNFDFNSGGSGNTTAGNNTQETNNTPQANSAQEDESQEPVRVAVTKNTSAEQDEEKKGEKENETSTEEARKENDTERGGERSEAEEGEGSLWHTLTAAFSGIVDWFAGLF